MRAWGDPDREAIHTGTFFGDPIGAAAALATLDVIEEGSLPQVAAARGKLLEGKLVDARLPAVMEVRGVGLMLGLQLRPGFDALTASRALLERGFLVLPAGADADVIQLAPPVTITSEQVGAFVAALGDALEER